MHYELSSKYRRYVQLPATVAGGYFPFPSSVLLLLMVVISWYHCQLLCSSPSFLFSSSFVGALVDTLLLLSLSLSSSSVSIQSVVAPCSYRRKYSYYYSHISKTMMMNMMSTTTCTTVCMYTVLANNHDETGTIL